MTYGFQIGNLELSEYPINYVDTFFLASGATISKNYTDFSGLSIIVYPQLAQPVSITSVYYPPTIYISGTSVTAVGRGVDSQIFVFAR